MGATDKTLGDFAKNPGADTYDGRKVARWLFEAMTGKPMSEAEADELVTEAQARATRRKDANA